MCARSRRRVSKRRDGSERHTRIENDGDGASRSSDEWQRALVEREVLCARTSDEEKEEECVNVFMNDVRVVRGRVRDS